MDTVRVVIADDHPVVRSGLRALLTSRGDYEVLGEARDGEEAVAVVLQTRPDVVLLDIAMPRLDGVEATRRIKAAAPGVGVLMMTMADDPATVRAAVQAGADGYLLKGAEQEELDRAVRAVAAGGAIFTAAVTRAVLRAGPEPTPGPFPRLTAREREVLALVAEGLGNAEIGRRLFLASKTVANHVSSILLKLDVPDRVSAVVRARREGWGGP